MTLFLVVLVCGLLGGAFGYVSWLLTEYLLGGRQYDKDRWLIQQRLDSIEAKQQKGRNFYGRK